jgi:type II secretory pathway component PulK
VRNRKSHQTMRRSGVVLIAALVCLLILTSIIGTMLQTSLRSRRQLRSQRDLIQCELLLQAGVDRAAFRLSGESDYKGETWNVPADAIIGSGGGQVTIEASRESGDESWQVRVAAEYPVGSERSIRRSKTTTFSL